MNSALDASAARFEELLVGLVIFLAGVVGVFIGGAAPRANATELVLGGFFAILGLSTMFGARSRTR